MEALVSRPISLRAISVLVAWSLLAYACNTETEPATVSPTQTQSYPSATISPTSTRTDTRDSTPTEPTAVSLPQTESPPIATLSPNPMPTETLAPLRGNGGENLIANPHCDGKHSSRDISGWSQSPPETWTISYFKNPSPTTSACKLAAPDGEGSLYQDVPFRGRNLTFGWTYINVNVINTRVDVLCDGVIVWTPINRTEGTPDPNTWVSESFATTLAQDCSTLRLSISGAFTGTLGLKFYDTSLTSN